MKYCLLLTVTFLLFSTNSFSQTWICTDKTGNKHAVTQRPEGYYFCKDLNGNVYPKHENRSKRKVTKTYTSTNRVKISNSNRSNIPYATTYSQKQEIIKRPSKQRYSNGVTVKKIDSSVLTVKKEICRTTYSACSSKCSSEYKNSLDHNGHGMFNKRDDYYDCIRKCKKYKVECLEDIVSDYD